MADVMLVEDDKDIARLVEQILGKKGHKVKSTENGEGSLTELKDYRPDLILMDIFLPGRNGVEAAKKIKENKNTQHVPVILFTVLSDPLKVEEAIEESGADGYLGKPFGTAELVAKVERFCK